MWVSFLQVFAKTFIIVRQSYSETNAALSITTFEFTENKNEDITFE